MPFIDKLYEILKNKDHTDIISWNEYGDKFEIKDENRMKDEVLLKYFKHDNMISFVR